MLSPIVIKPDRSKPTNAQYAIESAKQLAQIAAAPAELPAPFQSAAYRQLRSITLWQSNSLPVATSAYSRHKAVSSRFPAYHHRVGLARHRQDHTSPRPLAGCN